MFSAQLIALAKDVIKACKDNNLWLTTAESCTGGLIAGCLTSVSGASGILQQGFITYANESKINLLGVEEGQLAQHGAVSEQVSRAMAEGAIHSEKSGIAVSVTGIAGPGGGSREKPVGLVHISVARTGFTTRHERHVFAGDRNNVRLQAVEAALKLLLRQIAP